MSPSKVSRRIVLDRSAWVDRMLGELRSLPLAARLPPQSSLISRPEELAFDMRLGGAPR